MSFWRSPNRNGLLPAGKQLLAPLFFYCLFSAGFAASALAQYRFDYWTTDNGLPQNTVRAIVQTRDGYLWFTTFDGLVRYDGVRFTVFNMSNSKGLTSNRFTCLIEAKDGSLWAGTEDGGLTRYAHGVFTSFTKADGAPNPLIYTLQEDPDDGGLLLKTTEGMLEWRDGRFLPATQESHRRSQIIYFSPTGARWSYDEDGLHRFKDGQSQSYLLPKKVARVWSLYEDRSGDLWVGAEPLSVYRVKDGTVTSYDKKDGLIQGTQIWAFCQDAGGGLWVGVLDGGLYHLQDRRFTQYTTADGLSSGGIFSVLEDNEGSLWIGTSERGLNRITKQFISTYSTRNGLYSDNVYPMLEDGNGDVWIGASVAVSRLHAGHFINYTESDGLRHSNIQALHRDRHGTLWVGAVGYVYRFIDGRFQLMRELSSDGKVVAVIQSDSADNLWIGSDQGLTKYKDGQITRYTTRDGLPSNDVKVIHEDRYHTLWFGTYGGIACLKDGKFTSLTTRDGLVGDRVRSIYEEPDGTFWIGTYDSGLSRFKDGQFTNYRIENGLFNDGVFQILEDHRGNFWMSCNRGIYRASKQQLNDFAEGKIQAITCIAYGKQDGMLNTEGNGGRQPAGIKTRDGKLWFPSQGGVVVIDPDLAPFNSQPPRVVIESVVFDRNAIAFESGVRLEPGQQNLEINYTGLSFIKPEQVRFKYKLEGNDADWIDAGTRRAAYFPYLPPGKYNFTVIAANSDGVWNDKGASIRVIVIAPFYRRWWFTSLMLGAGACLAMMIFRLRVARLRKEHETREAFSRRLLESQETFSRRLLESQEQERKRIAAELHDSLGQNLLIIKNCALLGLGEDEDGEAAKKNLNEISNMTSQALDEVRAIAHNLRPYQIDRLGLTRALKSMVNKVADSSTIEFTGEIDAIDDLFSKEAEMNLYRIVQESINNIIKHSGATEASVTITRNEHSVHLQIKDNGKGFLPPTDAASNQGGFGLTGIAERVRMLGGKHAIESVPGKGTSINIKID